MNETFIADENLGRLVTWLRILGYDTTFYRGRADREFLRQAQREGRIALSKKEELTRRQYDGRLLIVHGQHVADQIDEVLEGLELTPSPGRLFSLCLVCNEPLRVIDAAKVEGLVPGYVFVNQRPFRTCPVCRRIFWPGSHGHNVRETLRKHIPFRHP